MKKWQLQRTSKDKNKGNKCDDTSWRTNDNLKIQSWPRNRQNTTHRVKYQRALKSGGRRRGSEERIFFNESGT